VLGKKGDEVSLLLQAEQKAMKISRRTDPICILSGLQAYNARLYCFVQIFNSLLQLLQNLLMHDRFVLFLFALKNDVYDGNMLYLLSQ
jgi:hypothetical protein